MPAPVVQFTCRQSCGINGIEPASLRGIEHQECPTQEWEVSRQAETLQECRIPSQSCAQQDTHTLLQQPDCETTQSQGTDVPVDVGDRRSLSESATPTVTSADVLVVVVRQNDTHLIAAELGVRRQRVTDAHNLLSLATSA